MNIGSTGGATASNICDGPLRIDPINIPSLDHGFYKIVETSGKFLIDTPYQQTDAENIWEFDQIASTSTYSIKSSATQTYLSVNSGNNIEQSFMEHRWLITG